MESSKQSQPSKNELNDKISKAFDDAWTLINTRSGWNPAKLNFLRSQALDKIEWRRKRTGGGSASRRSSGIVYRVTATLPASKENVAALLRDVNNIASWNRTLQAVQIVKHLSKDTVITYHITSSATRGIMFPRDFVLGVKFGLIDGCFVAGGCSVDYNGPGCDEASDGEMVRAFLWPGCIVARPIPGMPKATTLQWLLDIDYKGWVPRCVLDLALPFAQVLFIESVAKAVEVIEREERKKLKKSESLQSTDST